MGKAEEEGEMSRGSGAEEKVKKSESLYFLVVSFV